MGTPLGFSLTLPSQIVHHTCHSADTGSRTRARLRSAVMADSPKPTTQCPKGEYCVNLAEVREALGKSWAELHGSQAAIQDKVEDLRREVSAMPRQVTEALRDEGSRVAARLVRGEGHFDEIFRRLGQAEKQRIILWVLIIVLGLGEIGKLVAWAAPIFGKAFP